VNVAGSFGHDLADIVADHSPAFGELFKTLEHDYYTFTHVCNVSLYTVIIARGVGALSPTDLAALASAALLHDIGKRHIPQRILNKAEKLTDEEWALLMEHPTTGFRDLASRDDLTWAQLMVVYQHHERLDGTGYPAGLEANEIHPWARICAVADVFDAMTCHRPYRKAAGSKVACEHLKQRAGTAFDAEAVKYWTSQVGAAYDATRRQFSARGIRGRFLRQGGTTADEIQRHAALSAVLLPVLRRSHHLPTARPGRNGAHPAFPRHLRSIARRRQSDPQRSTLSRATTRHHPQRPAPPLRRSRLVPSPRPARYAIGCRFSKPTPTPKTPPLGALSVS